MDNITVDATDVLHKLGLLGQNLKKYEKQALSEVGEEILRLSQLEVPHDTGDLQDSGAVEPNYNGNVVVGYHTPYAHRLHENPQYNFQKGRKGKYLEDPIKHNRSILGNVFGLAIKDIMKRSL